eukprot:TRINITY_DN2485_c0_g1_i2.p1 TRINITY_DN2485_c0_g1~~TRINITY_DN2485_c0_g1_i2.p1  ORF type:complete len:416 (+),score=149.76 TRINITY_DN2485_c0_g1_i2:87-1334(+)
MIFLIFNEVSSRVQSKSQQMTRIFEVFSMISVNYPMVASNAMIQVVYIGSNNGMIICHDGKNLLQTHSLTGHTGPVCACSLSPGMRFLASCSTMDGTIRIWELQIASKEKTDEKAGRLSKLASFASFFKGKTKPDREINTSSSTSTSNALGQPPILASRSSLSANSANERSKTIASLPTQKAKLDTVSIVIRPPKKATRPSGFLSFTYSEGLSSSRRSTTSKSTTTGTSLTQSSNSNSRSKSFEKPERSNMSNLMSLPFGGSQSKSFDKERERGISKSATVGSIKMESTSSSSTTVRQLRKLKRAESPIELEKTLEKDLEREIEKHVEIKQPQLQQQPQERKLSSSAPSPASTATSRKSVDVPRPQLHTCRTILHLPFSNRRYENNQNLCRLVWNGENSITFNGPESVGVSFTIE